MFPHLDNSNRGGCVSYLNRKDLRDFQEKEEMTHTGSQTALETVNKNLRLQLWLQLGLGSSVGKMMGKDKPLLFTAVFQSCVHAEVQLGT